MYSAGQVLKTARVRKGQAESVQVGPNAAIQVTTQRGRGDAVQASIELPTALVAPLKYDTAVGKLKLTLDGKEVGSYPLYPLQDVAEAGFFGRTVDSIKLWFE